MHNISRTFIGLAALGFFLIAAIKETQEISPWGAAITGALLLIASLIPKGAG